MPTASINGVAIYYEVTGAGEPLVFSHEFAGDHRSWASQVRALARRYQVITYSNRGYPPSGVPEEAAAYSQERLVEDLRGLLDHLGIERAHLCGLSMGSYTVLNFALAYPARCRTIVLAGCGTGSNNKEQFQVEGRRMVDALEAGDMRAFADVYCAGPVRHQLKQKDPLGWQEFRDHFAEHPARAAALIFGNVQLKRPTVYDLEPHLGTLDMPALVVVGDEDEPCLLPSLSLKSRIRGAGLAILPATGHTVNLEEPELFNRFVLDFLTAAERGRWPIRERAEATEALF